MTKVETGTLTIALNGPRTAPKTPAQIEQDADALDEIRRVVSAYLDPGNMDPQRHLNAMNQIIGIIDTKTDHPTLELGGFEPGKGTQPH